ncbi:glycosyl hydrolase family 8 [Bosea sp. AAP35]|uniref:glycosyl hydrolase family 8 n=1 Tax=Bosea sp. AAP35 TaxID=1523417 RepID=UPI000A939A89|nr:glycosyl hydrolase family 8 [Bosea sp. AAP35]
MSLRRSGWAALVLAFGCLSPAASAETKGGESPRAQVAPVPKAAALLAKAWPGYRARFVQPDGRVIDNGNGGISHSEGQGYAMVLALAAQDREAFERIWEWTARELYIREDGLAAWRWDPKATPQVTDRNNASDGDLLIAWALGEAALRWDVPDYQSAMTRITAALFRHNVIPSRYGPILLPGAVGFDAKSQPDGPVVNLSYWVFPALDRLEQLAPGHDWAGLRRSGVQLLRESRFGPLRVPPEWLALGGDKPAPAAKFERRFSYNAVRIPLYVGWSGHVSTDLLRPYATMWNAAENLGPFVLDIDDGQAGATLDAPGYRLIFAFIQCVLSDRPVPPDLATGKNDLYYPSTLALLSTLAISERRPQCL